VKLFGEFDNRISQAGHFFESSGVCNFAEDGGGGGGLRADKVALVAFGSGAAGEIAVKGSQGNDAVAWGKSLANAGTAGTLENACSGSDEVGQCTIGGEHLKDLAAAWGDAEFDGGVNFAAFEDFGGCH